MPGASISRIWALRRLASIPASRRFLFPSAGTIFPRLGCRRTPYGVRLTCTAPQRLVHTDQPLFRAGERNYERSVDVPSAHRGTGVLRCVGKRVAQLPWRLSFFVCGLVQRIQQPASMALLLHGAEDRSLYRLRQHAYDCRRRPALRSEADPHLRARAGNSLPRVRNQCDDRGASGTSGRDGLPSARRTLGAYFRLRPATASAPQGVVGRALS